jgi:hypothetical protein
MQSLSLKMFISIYMKPVHKPAMDSPIRRTQGAVCLGIPITVVERWFPALYPASFH